MSSRSSSLDSALASDKTENYESSPSHSGPPFYSSDPQVGRHIFEVTLEKEESHGIGLTIVGGEATNSLDLGIFIKSVAQGGPALQDGRIQPGDRLIAINGISLEGKQHHEAVSLIRDGGDKIVLLVSQIRPPGTIKRKEHLDPDAAELKQFYLHPSQLGGEDNSPWRDYYRGSAMFSDDRRFYSFDDIVNSHTFQSGSDSDNVYNSDEEKFPIKPSSSPPPPPFSSELLFQENNEDDTLRQRSSPIFHTMTQSSPSLFHKHFAQTQVKRSPRDDEELSFKLTAQRLNMLDEIPHEDVPPIAGDGLTQEEREDLEILGDIAALDAEDSSSDSDFDTAIKKTIEGTPGRPGNGGKSVNTPTLATPTKGYTSRKLSASDVMYEVILERQDDGVGIVPNDSEDEGFPTDGVFIKEIVPGSSAELGGILAIGDKLLEVSGESVDVLKPHEVQELLQSAPPLCTVKVVRSADRDAALTGATPFGDFGPQTSNLPQQELPSGYQPLRDSTQPPPLSDKTRIGSLSKLITSPPKERTKPLDEKLNIVPPPPPLTFTIESESNTQSDVDSDVLDSSRSELENIYKNAETFLGDNPGLTPRVAPEDVGGDELIIEKRKMPKSYGKSANMRLDNAEENNNVKSRDTDLKRKDIVGSAKLQIEDENDDNSVGFTEHLAVLKNELDSHLKAELSSQSQTSSSESSFKTTQKERVKLIHQSNRFDSAEKEGQQNLDVSQDSHQSQVKDIVQQLEKKLSGKGEELDPFEPELLKVTLEKQGRTFGFTVAGGMNTGGCYVKQLVSDPAIGDGRMRAGDRIIQVNGQDTTMMTHFEAVSLLRKITESVTLHLLRYPSSMETQERFHKLQDDAFALTKPSDVKDSKDGAEKVKKSVTRCVDTPKAIIKPYDHQDQFTADLRDEDVDEVKQAMEDLFLSHDEEENDSRPDAMLAMMRIELFKSEFKEESLGLSLVEREEDGQTGIHVNKIQKDGIVATDGQLQVGDRILQANGISFIGLSQHSAASVLRDLKGKIILTISRPPNTRGVDASERCSDDSSANENVKGLTESEEDITSLMEFADSLLDVGDDHDDIEQAERKKPKEFNYVSPRKPDVDLPVILTDQWLDGLPLLCLPSESESYATQILQSLADIVESREPYEEFNDLRQMKEESSCDIGRLVSNKGKNRYRNVLPYDWNRVVLDNDSNNYINASYITAEVGDDRLKYIASQGPSADTVSDFWSMVWQEGSAVVVMLTQMTEKAKVKCHMYWPQSKDRPINVDNGSLIVKLIRSYSVGGHFVAGICIEEPDSGKEREVTLLQFLSWPDHGAPETSLPLLKLLQLVHLCERGAPAVIHCSAGIGRTGALIAIDIALAAIERGIQFDMHKIVKDLRKQRYGMIQTTDQYLFCYTACMEALLSVESHE